MRAWQAVKVFGVFGISSMVLGIVYSCWKRSTYEHRHAIRICLCVLVQSHHSPFSTDKWMRFGAWEEAGWLRTSAPCLRQVELRKTFWIQDDTFGASWRRSNFHDRYHRLDFLDIEIASAITKLYSQYRCFLLLYLAPTSPSSRKAYIRDRHKSLFMSRGNWFLILANDLKLLRLLLKKKKYFKG